MPQIGTVSLCSYSGDGITFLGNRTKNTDGVFSFPDSQQAGLDIGHFGPNFTYTAAVAGAVPEPGTWMLMLMLICVFATGAAKKKLISAAELVPAHERLLARAKTSP